MPRIQELSRGEPFYLFSVFTEYNQDKKPRNQRQLRANNNRCIRYGVAYRHAVGKGIYHIMAGDRMSVQSDAAKAHIEKLLNAAYPEKQAGIGLDGKPMLHQFCWKAEYRFAPPRMWRFDYAVPAILCANYLNIFDIPPPPNQVSIIEIDGGTFKSNTGHNSGIGLRAWREKNNAAMSLCWRVWHYAPEEIIKAARKTLPNEPILKRLPWL